MIFKHKKLSTALITLALILSPSTVFANTTANSEINGGELSLTGFPTSISTNPITLDGVNWQHPEAYFPDITVIDGRGTGEGWKLSVSASQITEVGGLGLTLPIGSLTFNAPVWVSPADSNSPVLATGNHLIDSSPFTIARAVEGTGLGQHIIEFNPQTIRINISPRAKLIDKTNYPNSATPYQTTITWTLSNTP